MAAPGVHEANKRSVFDALRRLCAPGGDTAAAIYAPDASCFAYHPVDALQGREAIVEQLWRPLRKALPDVERRDAILLAGRFAAKNMVAAMGHYQGTFTAALFDVPPTQGVVHVRYAEIHVLEDGRITHSWVLVDLLDLMRQAGRWPIAPALGAEGMWPGPAPQDGVRPDSVDSKDGAASLALVKAMHEQLLCFDGRTLDSMDHAKYWTANFMWYGPSGIGTTRGLTGFRAHHQIPFLQAFPDRSGGRHVAQLGDGAYVVTGGWPSVVATHTGPGWLGLAPSGRHVGMRVMDFYRLERGLIAENWVPIDVIDVLRQLGVDVFARLRHLSGRPRREL